MHTPFLRITATPIIAILIGAATFPPGSVVADDDGKETVKSSDEIVSEILSQGKAAGTTTRSIAPRGAGTVADGQTENVTRSFRFVSRGIPRISESAKKIGLIKATEEVATEEDVDQLGSGVTEGETKIVDVSYELDGMVDFGNLQFLVNSNEFADPAYAGLVLGQIAGALNDPKLVKDEFVVEGHASAEGGANANRELSERRAARIVAELEKMGVGADRLSSVGVGEKMAVAKADAPESERAKDRRAIVGRLASDGL